MTAYPSIRAKVTYLKHGLSCEKLAEFEMDTCINTAHSTYFICPYCGDIWAEAHVSLDGVSAKWNATMRPCQFHRDGSLLHPDDWKPDPATFDSLPLLTREFRLPNFNAIYGVQQ